MKLGMSHFGPFTTGRPSLMGHFGHCWTCSLPHPVAHDPSLPSAAKFAMMQNAASFNDVIGCGPRMRETHEAARIHHARR